MALARVELPDDVAASVLVALNTFAPAHSFAASLVLRHSTVLLDFLLLPLIRQAPPQDQRTFLLAAYTLLQILVLTLHFSYNALCILHQDDSFDGYF